MLFLHETHQVKGEHERDFEAAYRDEFLPELAKTDGARLLWYLNHAHGTGPSYNVVTVTAFADGAAWEAFADRVRGGDLQAWMGQVDQFRHHTRGKALRLLPWSPMRDLQLTEVPVDGAEHDLSLYMQDTMWTRVGKLHEYIEAAGDTYRAMLERRDGRVGLRIHAGFRTAPGAGTSPEVTLLQHVPDPQRLLTLMTTDMPEAATAPGAWMHTALTYRDRWESKVLRTAAWSPLL